MIHWFLSRLSGLGAAEAVAGLTSAINSFNSTGVTSAEVLNKLSAAAVLRRFPKGILLKVLNVLARLLFRRVLVWTS